MTEHLLDMGAAADPTRTMTRVAGDFHTHTPKGIGNQTEVGRAAQANAAVPGERSPSGY
jgi:hypothetical protein